MKPRVLILDDSVTVRMDLKESLEEAGFETVLCATAASARDVLNRERFDLMLLDVLLPDADGVEYLKELKSAPLTAAMPVMLLSSEAEVGARVRGLKTGAEEYLGKPYNPVQVVSRARDLVRRGNFEARERSLALIIDDSPTFQGSLKEALEEGGYDVALAGTGEDGLLQAANLRPDIVLVDHELPGMQGEEVLRRIRADAALRRLPCILLTASDKPGREMQALEAGADAFVSKGGDLALVLVRMAALLRSGRQTGSGTSLLAPKRILAVDDSLTYLEELAEQLRAEGYDVASAASGEEALELLAVQQVDAILLDFVMPGLSGKQVCERVKANPSLRDVPLLMLTALSEQEAMLEGINAGADDYITKSADFGVLKARLKAQLRRRQFEDENRAFREQLLRREMEALEVQAVRELAETRAANIVELERRVAERTAELEQRALELARSNEELERFAFLASHDLQEPLRQVGVHASRLEHLHEGSVDPEVRDAVGRMRLSLSRMRARINGLLEYSRARQLDTEPGLASPEDALKEAMERLLPSIDESKAGVSWDPLPRVKMGYSQLVTLFEHLLSNALKFRGSEPPRVRVSSQSDGQRIVFSFEDNGIGIEREYWEKIFVIFQRLHPEDRYAGLGVGLAICKRLVENCGGSIRVQRSEIGKGSTFCFDLPGPQAHVPGAQNDH